MDCCHCVDRKMLVGKGTFAEDGDPPNPGFERYGRHVQPVGGDQVAEKPCCGTNHWTHRIFALLLDYSLQLGVLPEAVQGWGMIHQKPHIAFCCCCISNAVSYIMNFFAFSFASQPMSWHHHGLFCVYAVCHLAVMFMLWRYGPATASRAVYKLFVVPVLLFQVAFPAKLLLGDLDNIPYHDRLAFTLHGTVNIF